MGIKILLINPNRMQNPPVIPIGLEYLATALEKHDHDVTILDLCFASSPIEILKRTLKEGKYDLAGFSIRNIDSCVYFNNEFYLSELKKLIDCVKNHNIRVVLGGSGFSAMPNEILEYLQADYGIIGPGEVSFPKFLELWQTKQLNKKILNGWDYGLDDSLIHKRTKKVNYQQYVTNEGIVGFTTHSGCQNQCPYCIEAGTKVSFKKITNILAELEYLVNLGYTHFHLCDSEFNSDLNFSIEFCENLVKKALPLKWTLYMKPFPYNERLFQLLHKSNAYLITLSVDSDKITQTLNNYSYDDLVKIIDFCKKYKIEIAIDLITGYPYETLDSTKKTIEFFQKHRPTTVGISFYYRIYKNTTLEKSIRNDPELQKKLTRMCSEKENFLKPIFFSQYKQSDLEELIAGDDLFRIAGLVPGVNYQL
ncbi:MAG: radical SAM protein [Promethearchaeota archaeon]|nr:MAG: radical SAM protein [Candidatus Lokiarchaeota archaeon]